MTHEERIVLIHEPFPLTKRQSAKTWAGVMVRDTFAFLEINGRKVKTCKQDGQYLYADHDPYDERFEPAEDLSVGYEVYEWEVVS